MENSLVYGGDYRGPAYEFTSSVNNLRRLPRFGHGSDVTALLSPRRDEGEDYAAGLVAMFVFLLIIFVLWTVAIVVFKAMGQANAGFLSGERFVVPDPEDDDYEENVGQRKRPFRVRVVFLVATALLMTFAFLFVVMGLTNVNNAATTMSRSLKTTDQLLQNAEAIATELEKVGDRSIEIRDAAVAELDDLCPANPDIVDFIGVDIVGVGERASSDLTKLADFISDGLEALNEKLALVREFTTKAEEATEAIQFWRWETKLLVAGLFVLPSFLAVGVGLVALEVDVEPYQGALTYFFVPLFALTIVACYVVCCLILPVSAVGADACSGGGADHGGPDDTILTVFRNLRGNDTGLLYKFLGFYTQRCDPGYYPFGFLSSYLDDLDEALDSTGTAFAAMDDNRELLEAQCGREYDDVLEIVGGMNDNLRLLKSQADLSLDLVRCENVNRLYVNTVHEAGCTYTVDAVAWTFASSLVISVCGLVMITLRSACYPAERPGPGGSSGEERGGKDPEMDGGPSRGPPWGAGAAAARASRGTAASTPSPAAVPQSRARTFVPPPPPPVVAPPPATVTQFNDDEFELDRNSF